MTNKNSEINPEGPETPELPSKDLGSIIESFGLGKHVLNLAQFKPDCEDIADIVAEKTDIILTDMQAAILWSYFSDSLGFNWLPLGSDRETLCGIKDAIKALYIHTKGDKKR